MSNSLVKRLLTAKKTPAAAQAVPQIQQPDAAETKPAEKKTRKAKAPKVLSVFEEIEQRHLQLVYDYSQITVPQFRESAECPEAADVLRDYVARGLLRRKHVRAAGRYELTEHGIARLKQLK